MTNYEKLIATLKEVFMLDKAELDFGIYRIMNQKRKDIEAFLETGLLPQVKQVLQQHATTDKQSLQKQLDEAVQQLLKLKVNPDTSEEVQNLRQQLSKAADVTALENEVFSHLASFFKRYFDNGDFISQRRYKRDVYSIPYEGEEVKLHWANHDQYYIKTGEYFKNYRFRISDNRFVAFELVEASTEKDNNKGQDGKERRFAIYEEKPLEVTGDTLTLYFTYEPVDKKLKREALLQQAFETVKKKIPADFLEVLKPDPTPANKTRTLLQKHLNDYTARNTFDYFIHKDLGGFLRRELDFYIKNEVLFIDDINTRSEGEFLQQLSLLKAIKIIGEKIITFLASLEDFQKKLWLKKKFVVETNYCVTLNRVPKELYPLIAANEAQTAEWVKLFGIDEIIGSEATEIFGRSTLGFKMPLTVEFLEQNPYLVLDTAFFDADFKVVLLQSFDDIEEAIDGLLIHGENFQALQLLQERYQEQVKCVYIDPPYNTGDDGFPYKDNFQHSSWISFIVDRLHLGGLMQTKDGTTTISIDDKEVENLQRALISTYGEQELAKLVWDRNKKNDAKFFSVGHEYMIVYAKDKQWLKNNKVKYREPREGLGEAQTYYAKLLKKYKTDWSKIKEGWDNFFENMVMSDPRKRMSRFGKVGPKGPYRDDGNINWPGGGGPTYEIKHPSTNKPVKIPKSGWRYPTKERFWEEYDKGKIVFGKDETTVPSVRSFLFESKTQIMPSVFYSYAQTASQEFEAIFGKKVFDNPKNWRDILRVISYLSDFNSIILDYFVGSGTTGHAVINLNRRDKSKRKYILVEMGDYFDTVTKPRIQKVVYSKDWKDGKPLNREGISHCFKYIRLESTRTL